MTIDKSRITKFHTKLFDWWKNNRRDLPWRRTTDPYKIIVSEFMLQQTQVTRVIPKYKAFLRAFPTFESLASAKTSEVLELWQGLGYNRRAKWLQDAAKELSKMEIFPQHWKELKKIKGIGNYSSRSILIFAFNHDFAAVDTNIRRILISEGFAKEYMKPAELQKIADELSPKGKSSDYHNAMMDFGSKVKTASKTGIKSQSTQPAFENSDRKIRGEIIKILIEKQLISSDKLFEILKERTSLQGGMRFQAIISKLKKEGMIIENNRKLSLPQ